MNENIRKLFQAMADDKSVAKKFKSCKNIEEAYKVATSIVGGYTIEEYKDVLKTLTEKARQRGELSDEELENVTGGGFFTDFWEGFKFGFMEPIEALDLLFG